MHVIPRNDAVAHDSGPDCICDPDLRDGVWVHHSLDGRELTEGAPMSHQHDPFTTYDGFDAECPSCGVDIPGTVERFTLLGHLRMFVRWLLRRPLISAEMLTTEDGKQ